MDWHRILPRTGAFTQADFDSALEIRLRLGQPLQLCCRGGIRMGSSPLTKDELQSALLALCGHSLAHREAAMAEGYIALPGGHRLGICGERDGESLLALSSLCIRIAHQVKDAAGDIFPTVYGKNTLILGPPGSGKTTLLRDLVRRTAEHMQVALVDSRGEIAAAFQGQPQLDVGPLCDVMTGGKKEDMMLQMLRSMRPDMMATDEIGTEGDGAALFEISRCGVGLMTTAHARNVQDAKERKTLSALMEHQIFTYALVLDRPGMPPRVVAL